MSRIENYDRSRARKLVGKRAKIISSAGLKARLFRQAAAGKTIALFRKVLKRRPK